MSRRLGTWIGRCAYAVGVMVGTLAIQRAVWPYIQPSPFLFLTLGVLVAGLHGDWAPGLVATALGVLFVDILFLPDAQGLHLTLRGGLTLILFAAVGVLVTWINVSRRRGLRAAVESEEWLRITLRSIGDAVIATDRDGRVRFLNSVAERLTGWRSQLAAGRPLGEVFHIINERTRREVESPVDQVIRQGTVVGLANHTLLVARDGSERVIEDSGAPIRDDHGGLIGVVLVFRDSTERAREEQRRAFLAEATTVLFGSLDYQVTLAAVARLLVPRVSDWVSVYQLRDGEVMAPLAIAHVDSAKTIQLQEIHRRYPPRDDREIVIQVARTQRSRRLERIGDDFLVASAHDQDHLALLREIGLSSAMVVPLVARGRTLGAMVFGSSSSSRQFGASDLELAEDLARRVAVAIDNALLYGDAQEAIRVRDEFLAIASHELRTPLTTLQLQLESMEMAAGRLAPELSARLRGKLDSTKRQSTRLANLIDSLLDVARITTGRLVLKPEPMDLVAIAAEIAERFHEQARAAGCALRLAAPSGHIDVNWDRLRVEQVLSNLLSNALKYGAGKPIDITIDQVDDRTRIVIRDRGIGVAKADAERIFGRFERAVSLRHYGGLGLGLFIARQIVEAHGGEIRVGSDPDQGAEFTVVMPSAVAEPVRAAG